MSKPKEMTPERLAETRERSARATWEAVIVDRHDLLAHVDALTERLETAERGLAKVESVHQSACRTLHGQAAGWKLCEDERNAQKARADAAEKKLKALVEAIDTADKAGEEVERLHKAWHASWNNRTRESPVDDSIADAAEKAREAQRLAAKKFGAALQDARGET